MIRFFKKHVWIIIIAFLLVLFPQSLTDQAKLNMRVIISGIGIDYMDQKYQLTAQVILPANGTESGGISSQVKFVTADAETIADGVQQISYKIGKVTELSHMDYILVGESMKDHNLSSALDYFFRNFKLKKSIMLLGAKGTAKDMIQKTQSLELSVALSLQKIYNSNEASLNGVATTYVDFVNASNSVSGTVVIDSLEISSGDDNSGGGSSGGSSGSGSGSGGQGQSGSSGGGESSGSQAENGNLDTMSPLLLYKDGFYAGKMEEKEQVLGYYFASDKSKKGNISVTNFNYAEAQNANINLRIDQMKKSSSLHFDGGKPVHTITITLKEVVIDEIASKYYPSTELYNPLEKSLQNELLKSAEQTIEGYVNSTFSYCQGINFDIFQTADLAYRTDRKKWLNFLDGLADPDTYMQDVTVVCKVKIDKVT